MKNINKYVLGIALTLAMFLSACKDEFLDRYPKANPSPGNFFEIEASAKSAAVAAYNPWVRTNLGNMHFKEFIILSDLLSDDGYSRLGGDKTLMHNWDFQPTLGVTTDWWKYIYQSVNAANFAVENIPSLLNKGLTQEQLNPYIAEARFIRAYDYLVLVTFFGEVPLNVKTLKAVGEYSQPKASVEAIYEQIISDFQFAKENLLDNDNTYKGTPTKSTAAAFLAKTYLYKGDNAMAETTAREAVTMAEANGYKLLDDYNSIFSIANEGNKELLFYFPFVRNNEKYSTTMTVERGVRDLPGQLNHIQGGEGWGYALPTRDLYDAFEDGDPRRGYNILAPGDVFGTYTSANPFTYTHETYNGLGEKVTSTVTYKTGDDVIYDYRWSPSGMNAKKMTESVAGLANVRYGGIDIPVMRMADLYLILAEALANQGKDEALTWVNKVRARPSVNMPAKTLADGPLVDIVRHERRVEFALEGQRIFDLLRWDVMKDVFNDPTKVKLHFHSDYMTQPGIKFKNPTGLSRFPKDQVLLPIPQFEIDQNSMINENNPGY